jgi:hypothetical protein
VRLQREYQATARRPEATETRKWIARAVLFADAARRNDRDRSSAARPLVLAPVDTTSQTAPERDRVPAQASKKARANSELLSACPTYRR